MNYDPNGMPFPRRPPFREPRGEMRGQMNLPGSTLAMPDGADTTLRAESILLEEFNQLGVAAYQAREESASLFNLYLLAAGALITGLGVIVNASSRTSIFALDLIQTIGLAVAGALSFAFFVRLADLSDEYRDALSAMERIKAFYIARLRERMPDFERAFRSRLANLPRGDALGRGATVIRFVMSALSAVCVAAAVGHGIGLWAEVSHLRVEDLRLGDLPLALTIELATGVFVFLAHLVYHGVMRAARERRAALFA